MTTVISRTHARFKDLVSVVMGWEVPEEAHPVPEVSHTCSCQKVVLTKCGGREGVGAFRSCILP